MSGAVSYHNGLAAEQAVLRQYGASGCASLAERWRGSGGEIDLILRNPENGGVIFVEVKKARDFAAAAARMSARQIGRIMTSAAQFLGTQPAGQDTDARFDVALVNDSGAVEILENAFGQF